MNIKGIGEVAAHLTAQLGEYVGTHRVVAAIDRLVARGDLVERRVGRQRVVFDADLSIIEMEFGATGQAADAIDARRDGGRASS